MPLKNQRLQNYENAVEGAVEGALQDAVEDAVDDTEQTGRDTCWQCFRPVEECFCRLIPNIENQTEILILQHRREQFHPFNTSRMVRRALTNSQLVSGRVAELVDVAREKIKPGAVLLYPGAEARPIGELTTRPRQLILLDGTWHHAKSMFRDIPILKTLPQIKINPAAPGQYKIRREPNEYSLATIEATLAALSEIEPDTKGLSGITTAFHAMVERQLHHPKFGMGWNHGKIKTRTRTTVNIPNALIDNLDNVVVAYGETAGHERERDGGTKTRLRKPIYWVAQRLATGETFSSAIDHGDVVLNDEIMQHLQLNRSDFANAKTLTEFRREWTTFLKPTDTLVVFSSNTWDLLKNIDCQTGTCVTMKCVVLKDGRRPATLEKFLAERPDIEIVAKLPGRAGKRLANAVFYAEYLHEVANADFQERFEK